MPRYFLIVYALVVLAMPSFAQLRIVDYNTAGDARTGLATVLSAIGDESVAGISRKIDMLALEEQDSSATTTQAIVTLLNNKYGAGVYARATLDGGTTGAGRPGLIYNTQTVQLIATTTASTLSSDGAARQTMRYQVRPVGYTATADFYVYASHYKSSDTPADAARRNVEAQQVRANADALGTGVRAIFAGDYNIYTSSEPMWGTLTAAGAGQAFDPVNRVGNWSNNSSFTDVHTQSPATVAAYGGQITGGMDDRFDFQLVTAAMKSGEGVSYIPGTYHAFGNTNTHSINGAITTGSAAALAARLPGYTQADAANVLTQLASVTDHLPVVADYQLPAKMGVVVGTAPAKVIRGYHLAMPVTVSNTAAVQTVNGADELDYTLGATGDAAVEGTASGTDPALGGGNAHQATIATLAAGIRTGSVTASSSSAGVANPSFSQPLSVTVLDPASPSLSAQSSQTTRSIALGQFRQGQGVRGVTLADLVQNLVSTSGFTAGLDLDSIAPLSGNTDVLGLAGVFTALPAGDAADLQAAINTEQLGTFSATYLLHLSDENLPGASGIGDKTLQVTLTAEVAVPEPGTMLAIGLVGIVLRRPRLSRASA